jgi:hypothetical protein
MRRQARFLLPLLCLVVLCEAVGSQQQPPTVNLRPGAVAPQPGIPEVRITVDRRRVRLGTQVMFSVIPASIINDPRYVVTLYFGDGQTQVMRQPQTLHLYRAVGNYTYGVDVKRSPPPNPPDPNYTPPQSVPRVTLNAAPVPAEEAQPVDFSAQLSSAYPKIQYRFVFGDGSSSNWQSSPQAEHRYARAGNYFAYVDISDGRNRIGGSPRKRVDVRHAASLTVALTASPSTSRAGEAVTFIASAPSARSNARYRFNFGDGTQTLWQADPRAQHAFQSLGSYRAQVQVSQFINNQTLSATSSPAILTVAAGPVGQPSPRPSPAPTGQSMADSSPTPAPDGSPIGNGSPTPAGTPSPVTQENTNQSADWFSGNTWWYLLIAAVILFLIYQASGLLFATQPTFTPFADQGVAAVAHDKGALPIDFELVLDPNVSGGDYSVTTDQPRLVMSAPEPEDRQIIEI